jgi:hypothetical protein
LVLITTFVLAAFTSGLVPNPGERTGCTWEHEGDQHESDDAADGIACRREESAAIVWATHRTRHHGSAAQRSRLIFLTHSTGVFALSRAAERFVRIHDSIIRKLNECFVDSVNIDF